MVSAEGQELGPVCAEFVCMSFDFCDCFLNVERIDSNVAAVGNLQCRERVDIGRLVVLAKELGSLAYVLWSKTSA